MALDERKPPETLGQYLSYILWSVHPIIRFILISVVLLLFFVYTLWSNFTESQKDRIFDFFISKKFVKNQDVSDKKIYGLAKKKLNEEKIATEKLHSHHKDFKIKKGSSNTTKQKADIVFPNLVEISIIINQNQSNDVIYVDGREASLKGTSSLSVKNIDVESNKIHQIKIGKCEFRLSPISSSVSISPCQN